MRVLHVQKANGIGGCERHLLTLLPTLAEAGVDVRMCVAATGEGEKFVAEMRSRGIDTTVVVPGPDANPLLIRRVIREIREFGPDLLHSHLIHADLHGQLAARAARIPSVSSVHGTVGALRRQPYRAAGRAIGHFTPVTIAISHHVRRFLESLGLRRPGSVHVVHYGLDPAGWRAEAPERAAERARLGLTEDDVAVAMTARLIDGKGHDLLLAAAEQAIRSEPRIKILIAGDGPARPGIERLARALPAGSVSFLGFVPDIRPLVKASDLLAFPTAPALGEGFGLAALEAMAAARPVVATAVGALPEVVEDGRTGMVVPPGGLGQLTQALCALARDRDLRERLGAAGRARAETEFGVPAMVERTLAVYARALEGVPASAGRSAAAAT